MGRLDSFESGGQEGRRTTYIFAGVLIKEEKGFSTGIQGWKHGRIDIVCVVQPTRKVGLVIDYARRSLCCLALSDYELYILGTLHLRKIKGRRDPCVTCSGRRSP